MYIRLPGPSAVDLFGSVVRLSSFVQHVDSLRPKRPSAVPPSAIFGASGCSSRTSSVAAERRRTSMGLRDYRKYVIGHFFPIFGPL